MIRDAGITSSIRHVLYGFPSLPGRGGGEGEADWDDVAAETSVPFESDALSAVTSSPSMENVDAGDETCSPSCELRRIVVREIILEISASKPFFY